jgi:hypothetical protein
MRVALAVEFCFIVAGCFSLFFLLDFSFGGIDG